MHEIDAVIKTGNQFGLLIIPTAILFWVLWCYWNWMTDHPGRCRRFIDTRWLYIAWHGFMWKFSIEAPMHDGHCWASIFGGLEVSFPAWRGRDPKEWYID